MTNYILEQVLKQIDKENELSLKIKKIEDEISKLESKENKIILILNSNDSAKELHKSFKFVFKDQILTEKQQKKKHEELMEIKTTIKKLKQKEEELFNERNSIYDNLRKTCYKIHEFLDIPITTVIYVDPRYRFDD